MARALGQRIEALKETQEEGWHQLADPRLTARERRAVLVQLKQTAADLRACLDERARRARQSAAFEALVASDF